jgi:hypothetical protein
LPVVCLVCPPREGQTRKNHRQYIDVKKRRTNKTNNKQYNDLKKRRTNDRQYNDLKKRRTNKKKREAIH